MEFQLSSRSVQLQTNILYDFGKDLFGLQDSFITGDELGMTTTLGSWAFVGAKGAKNSAITQLLIDAGLIILGKGNMTVRLP
jgi:hypothetical protein